MNVPSATQVLLLKVKFILFQFHPGEIKIDNSIIPCQVAYKYQLFFEESIHSQMMWQRVSK